MQPDEKEGRARSRRAVLDVAEAAATTTDFATLDAESDGTRIKLTGVSGGWVEQSPSSLASEVNPPLQLEPGEKYTVVWLNGDGYAHNFVIIDQEGDEVVRSEPMEVQGDLQKVTFTATEEMDTYFCEFHPNGMRGDVKVEGQSQARREPQIPDGPTVGLEPVAEGFAAPLAFEYAQEERDRRFIVDQTGQIYVHGPDGLRDEPFLDIEDRIVELGVERLNGYDERGLLGQAFHPNFEETRQFYVRYSAPRARGHLRTTIIRQYSRSSRPRRTCVPPTQTPNGSSSRFPNRR